MSVKVGIIGGVALNGETPDGYLGQVGVDTNGCLKVSDSSNDNRGELLWSGRVNWTYEEDSLESIDVPALPALAEAIILSARNSSSETAVTVNVLNSIRCHPDGETILTDAELAALRWSLVGSDGSEVFTLANHGLHVGDALECVDAGDSGCTAGVVYYVHGADCEHDVTDNTLYLSLVRTDDGDLIEATGDTPGVFKLATDQAMYTSFDVPAWAAATSSEPEAGTESRQISGWGTLGGRIQVAKTTADVGVMSVYLEIRRA